jgi:hypothetical protein
MHKLNLTVPWHGQAVVSIADNGLQSGRHAYRRALLGCESNVIQQMSLGHPPHHLQHRRDQLKPRGQLLVVFARVAALPQQAVRQDAAFAEGVERTRRWPKPVWAGGA